MTRRSTLYLLRHAKSSWADESVPDLQRPLAPRGRRAAQQLAQHLRDHRIAPEVVLCSPALRTRQTLELIQPGLGAQAEVLIEDDLYGAGEDQLLARLRSLPDDVSSVLLIGHNPGIQDLAVLLVGGGADRDQLRAKFPTAALATIGVARGWAELGPGKAKLVAFRVPRGRP
jgi:phosphohistidine phosphatase